MDIQILGPLEVTDGSRALDLGGSRQRALLARLAIAANRVVAVDVLLDDLWGPERPPGAKQALQAQASRIRRALGDPSRITSRPPGYILRLAPEELDVARFEALLARARAAAAAGDLDAAARLWVDAERCWRGPALAELADYHFAQAEAARLEELRLAASEARVDIELTLGRHGDLVAELEGLVDEHPYRERLWAQLMLALYRCDRQADALGVYQRVRKILGEELGIVPGPDLARLEEAVLLHKPELTWAPAAAKVGQTASRSNASASEPPNNLPRLRSSFIGRQRELDELGKLLEVPGIVTITGPGGVGKTRLAIEAARRLFPTFSHGVWLAEFAPLTDPSLVPSAVAAALGLSEERERPVLDTVAAALVDGRVLLLLDNCEHLVDAVAALADALLAASANLTILATSREPLRIEGEVVWRTPSLPVPPEGAIAPEAALSFDSVRLLCERAETQSGFFLDTDNAPIIVELSRRLDGIPLALELAAARVGSLSPAEVLARLDDRFAILTQGRRVALPHHRTLQAAIEWSHDLLGPGEKRLFRRLSVFTESFTLEAAENVASGKGVDKAMMLDDLGALVDKSMVVCDGAGRYGMLETLRAYAAARLAEADEDEAVRNRHLAWFASLADDRRHRAGSPLSVEALDALEAEDANLRSALDWAIETGQAETAAELALALEPLWFVRGRYREAFNWFDRLLGSMINDTGRAEVLKCLARFALPQGEFDRGVAALEEALKLRGEGDDDDDGWTILSHLANTAAWKGDASKAREYLDEAVAQYCRFFPHAEIPLPLLGVMADVARVERDWERQLELRQEFLDRARKSGDDIAVVTGLIKLAQAAEGKDQLGQARQLYEEARDRAGGAAHAWGSLYATGALGRLELADGDRAQAATLLASAIGSAVRLGDLQWWIWLLSAASLASAMDCFRFAARLLGLASTVRARSGRGWGPGYQQLQDEAELPARVALGDEEYDAAYEKGAALTPDEGAAEVVAWLESVAGCE